MQLIDATVFGETLKKLLRTDGNRIIEESDYLRARLSERAPQAKREISLLVEAQSTGIPQTLRANQATSSASLRKSLTSKLRDERGLSTDAAEWAANSWASALGDGVNSGQLFSGAAMVPAQFARPQDQRIGSFLEWRGLPLAKPPQCRAVPANVRMPIAKRWRETVGNDEVFFLKLVDPADGTTTDYAIRCLFNPSQKGTTPKPRGFAFLELPPGVDAIFGSGMPVWTVVEVLDPCSAKEVRTLTPAEVELERGIIREIIDSRLSVPPEAIFDTFGDMPRWANPEYGEPGNLSVVCPKCLQPLVAMGSSCSHCAEPEAVW